MKEWDAEDSESCHCRRPFRIPFKYGHNPVYSFFSSNPSLRPSYELAMLYCGCRGIDTRCRACEGKAGHHRDTSAAIQFYKGNIENQGGQVYIWRLPFMSKYIRFQPVCTFSRRKSENTACLLLSSEIFSPLLQQKIHLLNVWQWTHGKCRLVYYRCSFRRCTVFDGSNCHIPQSVSYT